jgi:formamidopyrimidine-DNA glycosylase
VGGIKVGTIVVVNHQGMAGTTRICQQQEQAARNQKVQIQTRRKNLFGRRAEQNPLLTSQLNSDLAPRSPDLTNWPSKLQNVKSVQLICFKKLSRIIANH